MPFAFRFIQFYLLLLLIFMGCQSTPGHTPASLKQPVSILDLENEIHAEINHIRQKNGWMPLDWDHTLKVIALEHSRDMIAMNYFDHISPAGETPTERGLKNNYICRITEGGHIREGLAENLFKTSLYEFMTVQGDEISYEWRSHSKIIKNVVNKWLRSPDHRKNLLHPDYRKTGIGIAVDNNYEIWITQNFC